MRTKEKITGLLLSTGRGGMAKLIHWLEKDGFFESPASTRFHGCFAGGLAEHSLKVYELLSEMALKVKPDQVTSPGQKPLSLKQENFVIAALLHDICKIGAYIGTGKPYKYNKKNPKGHALLSIERIKKFIELAPVEELMIKYHMGLYGLDEFYPDKTKWDAKFAEYPLHGDHSKDDTMTKEESQAARHGKSMANAWFHNPICKVMYFCDELATLEEKAKSDN